MYTISKLIISVIFTTSIYQVCACKGCVNLDEISFPKILPRFEVVLVKFDVAFPYGDKHEVFTKLATEVVNNKDILLAEVGVKDYGEKDNEELAKSYGVSKDDFPAVKLFKKGSEEPIDFPAIQDFNLDNLRSFVRDNSDIYLGLPGCLKPFDKLAQKFVSANNKKKYLEQANELHSSLNEKEQEASKTYIVIMKKIIETGSQFISQEKERVLKLLKGKISSKKLLELQSRLNILRAFVNNKEEL